MYINGIFKTVLSRVKFDQTRPSRAKQCIFTGTVPVNGTYWTGTVPMNKNYPTCTVFNKLTIFSSKSTLYRAFHGFVCLAAPNRSYVTQRRCQKSTSRIGYRSTLRLFSWRTSRRNPRGTLRSALRNP